jgi:hypothetical protein
MKENIQSADNLDLISHVLNAINSEMDLIMASEESNHYEDLNALEDVVSLV